MQQTCLHTHTGHTQIHMITLPPPKIQVLIKFILSKSLPFSRYARRFENGNHALLGLTWLARLATRQCIYMWFSNEETTQVFGLCKW